MTLRTTSVAMTPQALLDLASLRRLIPGGFNLSSFVREALAVAAVELLLQPVGSGSREFRLLDGDTQEVVCDLVARWDCGEAIHPDDISIVDFRADMGFPRKHAIPRARRGPLDTVLSGSQWEDDEPPVQEYDVP